MSYDTSTADTRHAVERALAHTIASADFAGKTVASFPGRFPGDEATEVPWSIHAINGKIGPQGEIPEEWEKVALPALIVAAPESQPHPIGYDIVEVSLAVMASPEEIDGPTRVAERVGWLDLFFDEDRLDDLAEELSAGPVPITVIGIERDRPTHIENGRVILRGIKLRLHASADARES